MPIYFYVHSVHYYCLILLLYQQMHIYIHIYSTKLYYKCPYIFRCLCKIQILPYNDLLLYIYILQEVGGSCGDWMEVAQDRDRWRALVGTVRNLRVPKRRGIS